MSCRVPVVALRGATAAYTLKPRHFQLETTDGYIVFEVIQSELTTEAFLYPIFAIITLEITWTTSQAVIVASTLEGGGRRLRLHSV